MICQQIKFLWAERTPVPQVRISCVAWGHDDDAELGRGLRGDRAPTVGHRPAAASLRAAGGKGLLAGRLLDSGCGTGEQTLLAAGHGADAVGVDLSPLAVERARGKAADRGLNARFEVADALRLGDLGLTFDTVIDSGVFHVFDDEDRARYVASLASVLRTAAAAT